MRFRAVPIALLASLALAAGSVVAAGLFTPGAPTGAPLRLRTISMQDFASQGYRLSTAPQPAYCTVAVAVPLPGGIHGCPVSRAAATAAALEETGRGQVVESTLALVSWSNRSGRVSDRLAWVVVVYGGAVIVADPPACVLPPCPQPTSLELAQDRVVVVDARSGAVLTAVTVSPEFG